MRKFFVRAIDVREGDVLCFANPRHEVRVESISSTAEGRIGFHANSDTWTAFYNPENRVRIAGGNARMNQAAHTA